MTTQSEKQKLLPCPFCGKRPVYKMNSGFRAEIKCDQCLQAQVNSDWYDGDLGTMEAAWNTRTITDERRDWKPIESAPRDGKQIVVYVSTDDNYPEASVVEWDVFTWRDEDGTIFWNPTHWMPLPDAPTTADDLE